MVTMSCRAMEPMKSLDRGEISAHGQPRTARMTARRIRNEKIVFVSRGGPQGAREGIQASGEETSGHERSRMKTKKRCLQRLGACFVELNPWQGLDQGGTAVY